MFASSSGGDDSPAFPALGATRFRVGSGEWEVPRCSPAFPAAVQVPAAAGCSSSELSPGHRVTLHLCLSAPCAAEPELSAALWTIHCPRLFLFLLITEFTHLLKTVSKIQRKLDFPLIRFYGNWIFFFNIFLSSFSLEKK